MNHSIRSLSALALAAALLSTSSSADPPRQGVTNEAPSAEKKVAFRVSGLMKTKSGAT